MQQAEIPKSINNWLLMLSPYQVLVFSFLGLILVGAFLLMLPIASNDGSSLSFIDALFTATSAVCVTGLIVVDTGQYFFYIWAISNYYVDSNWRFWCNDNDDSICLDFGKAYSA